MSRKFSKYKLPKGWVTTTLNEVSQAITDGSHNPPKRLEKGVPMLSAQNINNGTIDFERARFISQDDFIFENKRTNIQPGDVLITTVATIGRVAIVPENFKKKFTIQRSVSVIKPLINGKYLMYYCQSPIFQEILSNNSTGTAQKGIYLNTLRSLPIPISSKNEQNRIVLKLEELLSDLDHSIENLKLAQKQLKVYRQALLKQAFEGKLTEKWREGSNPEPVENLLKKIKEKRQSSYEQKLKEWKKLVLAWEDDRKDGDKPIRPNKLVLPKDLTSHEILELHSIQGKWSKVGIVAKIEMGQSPPGNTYNNKGIGMPLINGPVEFGKLPFSKTLKTKWTTKPTKLCKEGDLILCVRGSTTGRQNIAGFDACIGRGVCSIRSEGMLQEYINHFFNYSNSRILNMGTGTTFPSISSYQLNELPIPVFALEEQREIIVIIEQQFSIIDKLEESINESLNSADMLRQSLLKNAFEGKLVDQDPNDRPSSETLLLIQQEKTKYLEDVKKQKKNAPKKVKKMSIKLSIEDVLKASNEPMLAKDVWQESIHKDSIEDFYAELKQLGDKIEEIREGMDSRLTLR